MDCGQPATLAGANFEGLDPIDPLAYKVGSQFAFSCRQPYTLAGNSSHGDQTVRCQVDGTWDFGNLRCEGKKLFLIVTCDAAAKDICCRPCLRRSWVSR